MLARLAHDDNASKPAFSCSKLTNEAPDWIAFCNQLTKKSDSL